MKLLQPENKDYAAYIVRLPVPVDLEGLDNLVGLQVLGSQALVAKDSDYGDLAMVFTAGTQLSEEFAYENSLHRHTDKNKDQDKGGYLEDNRHVRAIKLRGHSSSALVLNIDALSYIKKLDISQFKEGDTFDRIGDYEICKKYVLKKTYKERQLDKNSKIYSRVDGKFFPKHYDTDNYFKNMHIIPEESEITVTQKLHGTSIRIAHTLVERPFKFVDRIAKFMGAKIQTDEYDYIYGSRNAVKDATNPRHQHFYDSDVWSIKGQELYGLIPMGYLVFGELIGWTPEGAALQSKYTYQVPDKCAELYVYRVATINAEGVVHDLTFDQVMSFCKERGIKSVPLLWRGKYKDFDPKEWVDFPGHPDMHNYKDDGYPTAVPLAKESPCDEGVVIRAEGYLSPYTLKCKSETFVRHDNKVAEEGTLDMEEEGKVE